MERVELRLGSGCAVEAFSGAFLAEGYEIVASGADLLIAEAADGMPEEETRAIASFVVEGGSLLVLGGAGPLLAALHLRGGDCRVTGTAIPPPRWDDCFGRYPLEGAVPVSGVGHALLAVGGDCVLLGGPRGEGRVAFSGAGDVGADLVLAAARWLLASEKGTRGAF